MIYRLSVALLGAIVITSGLLLGMDKVTAVFRSQSGERYFRITDVLPRAERGRPDRPSAPAQQPGLGEPGFEVFENEIPLEEPGPIELPGLAPARIEPDQILEPE